MNCNETSTYEKSEIIKNVIVSGIDLEVLTETSANFYLSIIF